MDPSVPSLMQIGELSERAKLSHRTIHYYERLGLLAPARREGAGYRYYDAIALQRLAKIAALKRLGLSLDEIAGVLDLYFEDRREIVAKEKVLAILETQLTKTEAQLKELTAFRQDILANIARLQERIAEARGR